MFVYVRVREQIKGRPCRFLLLFFIIIFVNKAKYILFKLN